MADVPLSRNLRRVGHLRIPGGGQVVVEDGFAYVGHMKPPHGTSIVDVRDPANPRLAAAIDLAGEASHTHKVRVCGDIMIANVEQNDRHALRRGATLPTVEARLAAELGRPPSDAELGAALNVPEGLLPRLRHTLAEGYRDGGFRVFDVSDRTRPREIATVRTGGVGVHRFDMDARYAYISTELDGYVGNILVVYDIRDPARPAEVSRWWMPGQHVAGGETPTWKGQSHRLHHALRFGDELWASVWYAGLRVIDASDITRLRTVGSYNYHPPFPEPTHTVAPVPVRHRGRQVAVAVDEEHEHRKGQLHGGLWFFDVEDRADIRPLAMFHLSERDSPFSGKGRFGAHQFQERVAGDRLYCTWFSGGLRMLDISDPSEPEEIGWYIPEPPPGQESPQSNDVTVDERGLVYVIDRNDGLDILEPLA
ncbi:LVIVD repeat-containing protein [Prosthecomicrobium sp. N25]|uniref:LVIVD repeat-containing protein n=1 Tax=Prosthecomicrobium sp. N25 TaxID=3129254 RepID=UPI00307852D5